jgi:hypothetical protein
MPPIVMPPVASLSTPTIDAAHSLTIFPPVKKNSCQWQGEDWKEFFPHRERQNILQAEKEIPIDKLQYM